MAGSLSRAGRLHSFSGAHRQDSIWTIMSKTTTINKGVTQVPGRRASANERPSPEASASEQPSLDMSASERPSADTSASEAHLSDVIDLPSGQITLAPGLADFMAQAKERRWQLFFDYWRDLAIRLGYLPGRQDVDPVQMPRHLLPNIFLADVLYEADGRSRFRFRLLGQEIIDQEYTRPGQYLHELASAENYARFEPQYLDCLNRRLSLRSDTLRWKSEAKSVVAYEVLLLPLARDGRHVDAMIGLALYRN